MIKKHKRVFLLILALVIILALSVFWGENRSKNKNLSSNNNEIFHILSNKGYYLDVFTSKSKDSKRNGIINISDSSEEFYMLIQNIGHEREFVIKVYIDYEEVPIIINDKSYSEYFLKAEKKDSITIPFKLKQQLDSSFNHKMIVSLISGSNIHESDIKERPNIYCLTLNHTICFDKNNKIYEPLKKYEETIPICTMFSGIMLNTDFKISKDIYYPPYLLTVKSGEKFKLAYRAGGINGKTDYLIYLTIGWKQWELDNEKYKLIQTEGNNIGYGEVSLVAPNKPGLYEVCAWIIPDPFLDTEFIPIESSNRFTLKVE